MVELAAKWAIAPHLLVTYPFHGVVTVTVEFIVDDLVFCDILP
jgi:hypothetical protein